MIKIMSIEQCWRWRLYWRTNQKIPTGHPQSRTSKNITALHWTPKGEAATGNSSKEPAKEWSHHTKRCDTNEADFRTECYTWPKRKDSEETEGWSTIGRGPYTQAHTGLLSRPLPGINIPPNWIKGVLPFQ